MTLHKAILPPPSVVTIGTFDGIHIGHQNILKKVVAIAKANHLTPTVLTLFPHPRMVLQKNTSIKLLNTITEREILLKKYGIKEVIIKPFTLEFSNLSAENYITNILVKELNAQYIVVGYDHHFGKDRSANIKDLKSYAELYNFKVEEIPAQEIDAVSVSSTKIRNALQEGNVDLANSYLGYQYNFTGKVVEGNGIGRKINFRTANISIEETYKLLPKDGVYIVSAEIDNQQVYGMMNIGTNPTVDGSNQHIEVYFLSATLELYNKELKIEFIELIREEQKFDSISLLQVQLQKDLAFVENRIKKLPNL